MGELTNRFIQNNGNICKEAIADLRNSGLSDEMIISAGIKIFRGTNEELKKELKFTKFDGQYLQRITALMMFPYYRADGTILYYRFKPIPSISPDFKYLHPKGQITAAYIYPQVYKVFDHTSKPIWITEGEKKALKLCQHKRNAIALPGVWGFKTGKNSNTDDAAKELLHELREIEWNGRTVYLAFDNDLWTNQQVRYALYELSVKLLALGAIVKFPKWKEGKGIDDYLAIATDPETTLNEMEKEAKDIGDFVEKSHQKEIIRALTVVNLSPVISEQITKSLAKTLGVSYSSVKQQVALTKVDVKDDSLNDFFKRYALIRRTEFVMDLKTKKNMSVRALMLEHPEFSSVWRKSSNKTIIDAEKIVFKPDGAAKDEINLFNGLELKPKKGDCSLILLLLYHLCENNNDLFHWVLCWLAYPLQHIGAKMRTSLVFHGGQGSGKNMFFQDLMCKIYGEYSSYLRQDKLEEKYTDWMSAKLWVVCDEVLANKQQAKMKNLLKSYVTQDVVNVRRMYEPYREEQNHANFVFLSNESLPILIDTDDRRYVVVRQEKTLGPDFYVECGKQIESEEGTNAFVEYLLNYDVKDFNEHTKPIETEAKKDLKALCEPTPNRFLQLWQNEELEIPFCSCRVAALYDAFLLWTMLSNEYGAISSTRFSIEMKRMIERGKFKCEVSGDVQRINNKPTRVWFVNIDLEKFKSEHSQELLWEPDINQQAKIFDKSLDDFRETVEHTRLR